MTHLHLRLTSSTSVWLNLLRGLSAQLVLIGHLNLLNSLTAVPPLQTIAVIVFYILSGFLIMYSIDQKMQVPGYDFASFFIDRFSRIYPAYLATLLFVVLADAVYIYWFPASYTTQGYRYRLTTFIANLFFLEKINLHQSSFGTATQLWSLTPEWWLYMLAGYIAFSSKATSFLTSKRSICLLVVFLYVPVRFLFQGNPGSGTGIAAIWMFGALAYLVYNYIAVSEFTRSQIRLLSVLGLAFFGSAVTRYHMTQDGYDVLAGFDLTFAFLCSVLLSQGPLFLFVQRPYVQKLASQSAFYSYSLYLTHWTMASLCREAGVPTVAIWILCNIFAYGFAWVFERKYKTLALTLHEMRKTRLRE
jgi:peptidoglycan/LPS O-acetylase OafA/YrhL